MSAVIIDSAGRIVWTLSLIHIFLTSGTPTVGGFWKGRRDEAGRQFIDVGIAEENAAAMGVPEVRTHTLSSFFIFSDVYKRQALCI